jgi:hypothetical protein
MRVILRELKAKPHLAIGLCGIVLLVGVLISYAFWLQRLEYQHNLALANAMSIARVNAEQQKVLHAIDQLRSENWHRAQEIRESKQERALIRKDIGQVQAEQARGDGSERQRKTEGRP